MDIEREESKWTNYSTQMVADVVLTSDRNGERAGQWSDAVAQLFESKKKFGDRTETFALLLQVAITGEWGEECNTLGAVDFVPPEDVTVFVRPLGIDLSQVDWMQVAQVVIEKLAPQT